MKSRYFYAGALFVLIAAIGFLSVLLVQGSSEGTPPEEAQDIINGSGVQGGFIVHLNCGDGGLTEALRVSDSYLVHGLDPEIENVQTARQNILSKHKYGPVSVDQLLADRLPYRDNLVNLVVSDDLGGISMDEVMRILAPRGVACIKHSDGWHTTVKPWPDEMDEWTHWLHAADGNPVANDRLVGPPRSIQWIATPNRAKSHDAPRR